MKLLEVCVDSLASARAAKQGGADRLEFCSALAVGGLTPYADLLRQIKAELDLPVRCLMRPRAGDFLYTRDEFELLCRQIETLRSAGADGFVIGALTPEGALDLPAMRTLLDACGGAPVTLHRCIDVSRDLCATYRAAAALGIDTVLTSGGAGSCRKGISQLAALLRLPAVSYRADGLQTATADPARRAELDDVGLVRLLSPEQTERKVFAVFGGVVKGDLFNKNQRRVLERLGIEVPQATYDAFVGRDHQKHKIHSGRARHHGAHKTLVPRHVHNAKALPAGKIHPGKAKFNGDAPAFFFLQPVAVNACKRAYKGCFAVINVSCCA